MSKAVKKKYNISVRLNLEVGVDVEAENFDQAVEKAKALKLDYVVELHGDHNDSEMWINGVFHLGHYCSEGTPNKR